ncbi:MAG: hypothetical protein QXG98_01690 [Candidatus Micrarchaeia archaeon]
MRAQMSAEFVITLSLALSLLILMAVIYVSEERNSAITQERIRARHAAQAIALAVDEAFLAGNGTRLYIELDRAYNISIEERAVRVTRGSESGSFPVITNSLANATPLESLFSLTITNQNGVVVIG